jgi:hypothetical protein
VRHAYIAYRSKDLNFAKAALLATTCADWDDRVAHPVLLASYDQGETRMAPVIQGADRHDGWKDFGADIGGMLEVDVAGEYAFIYAEADPT